MATTEMCLYHLTLKPPTAIHQAIIGSFSGTKTQEILVAKNTFIELLRPNTETGKIQSVLIHNTFCIIRNLVSFRMTGGSKGILVFYNDNLVDYIVAGTDSGKIVIIEYLPEKNKFVKVHDEIFGKTGCRRIVPGQFVAVDSKGRAVMLAAVEKQKLVYILNRDTQAKMTINSPLEAHKSNTLTFHLVSVDNGYENPLFAALEVDFSEVEQDQTGSASDQVKKMLTYYEMDLGLNHIVRKWSTHVDRSANLLISLPGENDGPSGVLVCSKNYITWTHQNAIPCRIPIPRRPLSHRSVSDNVIIATGIVHKLKKGFFVLLQTEDGDIFKLSLEFSPRNTDGSGNSSVKNIKIKYFDTIPTSTSILILKAGFLFSASENGNHGFYQIENLGDDDESQTEFQSINFQQEGPIMDGTVYFNPRRLLNISLIEEIESLAPLIDAKVLNLIDDDNPQFYILSCKGNKSSVKSLKHGLTVNEVAMSELPANPTRIWTLRLCQTDTFDSYIVFSFANATLVLSVGETIEEVTDSGFLSATNTISVCQIGEDSLVQVYPNGIRHIRSNKRAVEWKCPGGKTIVKSDANQRQVVIALSSAEIVYFELDSGGNLNEYQERKEMSAPITSISIGPLPEGRIRSKYLAVGCADNTVRLMSLDPEECLQSIGLQALNAIPESVCICNISDESTTASSALSGLFLYVGLQTGVLIRSSMDDVTGTLSDTRMRFLGTRAVRLSRVCVGGSRKENALIALSSKSWLAYLFHTRQRVLPFSYDAFDFVASFHSEQCHHGLVSVVGNTLRILALDQLGNEFNQIEIPLRYTPRRFAVHPKSQNFITIETEPGILCPSKRQESQLIVDDIPEDIFGYQRSSQPDAWASCVRILNPISGITLAAIELDHNEAAFSLAICTFTSDVNGVYLVLGTAQNVILTPRSCTSGFLRLYKFNEDGSDMQLLHTTSIESIPHSVCAFQGKVLVGVGKVLRLYDIGLKKMLRKCENKNFPFSITGIQVDGDRICVSDIQESVHYAIYKHDDNKLHVFADDTLPRFITAFTLMDYDTVAGADKFGNVFVSRLPNDVSENVEDDPTGNMLGFDHGFLNGAPNRLLRLTDFHIGDIVTHLSKVSLIPGAKEVLLYTSLHGAIGIFIPFSTRDDIEFFSTLENQLRQELSPLFGRDHLSFRSFYNPVKSVVDGDLCEQYLLLAPEKRRSLAEEMERSASEIVKKLEDIRNRVAF